MVTQFTDSGLKTKPQSQNSILHISIPTLSSSSKHVAVNSDNGPKRTPIPAITAVLELHHPLQQNILHISKKKSLCVGFAFFFYINQTPKSLQAHARGLNIG